MTKRALLMVAGLALGAAAAAAQNSPTASAPAQANASAPAPAVDTDNGSGGRVVGGKDAAPGSAPWQAEIRILPTWPTTEPGNHKQGEAKFSRVQLSQSPPGVWQHWCGASYIAPGWVLTAAHCVTNADRQRQGLQVQVGIQNLSEPGRVYPIASVISHSGYYSGSDFWGDAADDIALVHFGPTAISGPKTVPVQAIPLAGVARLSRAPKANDTVIVTGWGRATANDPNDNRAANVPFHAFVDQTLQEVQLVVIDKASCTARWPPEKGVSPPAPTLAAGTVCATGTTPGKDACDGDSGGPMTRAFPNPVFDARRPPDPRTNPPYRAVLVGIVSWGAVRCGSRPGVYTDVAAFTGWIEANMGPDARRLVK